MKTKFVVALLLTSLAHTAHAQTQSETTPSAEPIEQRVSALEKLADRLDVTGYAQVRYLIDERTKTDNVLDGFLIRRARLKTTYDADWSKYVLQIDAVPSGVTLKDAEIHLIEPWTGYGLTLVAGQTKVPFGFQVGQSSSARLFPERARVIRSFFAGERDRGAKVLAKIGAFRFMGGVFNGNMIDSELYPVLDNDRFKDVTGRAGVDFGWISAGVSGWYGQTFRHAEDVPGADAGWFDRNRIGADLQIGYELLPIGRTSLEAEWVMGRTYYRSGFEQFGVPANGWYAQLAQQFLKRHTLAVRYDRFDPLAGTPDEASSSDPTRPASRNAVDTLGVAWVFDVSKHFRTTAAVELPMTGGTDQTVDPADNTFTLQLQAKF